MAKIKQSIVAQRQIPEHIRENYPLFVEFIKTYYDYLQQTQAQELETIRDVDTTLDEFIDKFKSELSKNFPINLASDKALILKHLREFYLARGSEDSFKFLFRVLFNKEAELFYPSTQVLRASDGRWKQDVSIFIDMTGMMSFEMSELIGRFITITTPTKVITTYVENTVNYTDTIHELFIQRDYANEITVGSIVRGETAKGVFFESPILQCPTKVKVFKGGAGFKEGDIFALNTQLGRGCLIKITKVDSIGSIKSVQIIKFGLDYVTKFYSYLSSKDMTNFEYIHPINLATGVMDPFTPATAPGYNSADPAHNEKAAGFIDSGWASKQTYFYYDTNVPVSDETFASDRYFADTGYVGDIQQQFYNDGSQTVMDEDLSIIEVDIGAVARYPGYYLKFDGFISDEIYIQDGNYYQAFSYVVRVEEELRRYADIVKALIHPSGMKIFSEYNIFNELNLRAKTPSVQSVLQLPLFDNPPSTVITGDRGIGWTQYTTYVDEWGVTHTDALTPAPGGAPVYSNQGRASLLSTKILADISDLLVDSVYEKHAYKPLEDYADQSDVQVKHAYKMLTDIVSQYTETIVRHIHKNHADNIAEPDFINSFVEKALIDFQPIVDVYVNHALKSVQSNASITDTYINAFATLRQETQIIDDKSYNDLNKITNDITDKINETFKLLKISTDGLSLYNFDFIDFLETFIIMRVTLLEDIFSVGDIEYSEYAKILTEIQVLFETYASAYSKFDADIISLSDSMKPNGIKSHTDSVSLIESPLILFQNKGKNFFEAINNSTDGRIQFNSYDVGGPDGYFDWTSGYQLDTLIT